MTRQEDPMTGRPNPWTSWPGAAALAACGVILAWPIVTGGWLTYLDNPAHLAEIQSLAFDGGHGWSDIAWLGYPLGRLHSPLWFEGFSALVRAGLPLGPVYGALVVAGFLVPPLVLFVMARRRAGALGALLLAWLLMVQKTSLVGYGSPLGGMWTFSISCGAYLLLLDRLARDDRRVGDLFWIAGLYGFLGITHLFTIVPAVVLFAVAFATRWRGGHRRFLLAQAAAAGVGALAAAAYWAPMLLGGRDVGIIAYNLTPAELLARFLLGAPVRELVKPDASLLAGVTLWTALPQLALLAAGVAGFVVGRRRDGEPSPNRPGTYGLAVAVVVFALLLALGIATMAGANVTWLGHVSWRMLFFVRLGLAVAAIPLLERWAENCRWPHLAGVAVPVVLVAFSVGLGAPLRAVVLDPDGAQMDEIRELWSWLGQEWRPDWGRVYLQDPFGSDDPLGNSHVLALTRMQTGIDQVGPLYAGSPFPTVSWLVSESRKLFGVPMRTADHFRRMLQLVPAANTTRVVLHWPDLAAEMVKKGYARAAYRSENFSVLELSDYPESHWAEPLSPDIAVEAERVDPGLWRVSTAAPGPGGTALLKVSWSPHWRAETGSGRGESPVVLDMHEVGLIRLSRLPAGRAVTMVRFVRPRWPDVVSVAGWGLWVVLLAAWGLVPGFRAALGRLEGGGGGSGPSGRSGTSGTSGTGGAR